MNLLDLDTLRKGSVPPTLKATVVGDKKYSDIHRAECEQWWLYRFARLWDGPAGQGLHRKSIIFMKKTLFL